MNHPIQLAIRELAAKTSAHGAILRENAQLAYLLGWTGIEVRVHDGVGGSQNAYLVGYPPEPEGHTELVPDWGGAWPLGRYPEYCRLILEESAELLLHGYFHRRRCGWGARHCSPSPTCGRCCA